MKAELNIEKVREVAESREGEELTTKYQLVLQNDKKDIKVTIEKETEFQGFYAGQGVTLTLLNTQTTVKKFTDKKKKK